MKRKERHIDLAKLITHGKVETKFNGESVSVWTTNSITSVAFNLIGGTYKRHSISLPDNYHIPFRLDMTIMIDFPALILLVGDGHIVFATSDNHKIEDIAKPTDKPNQDHCLFDNKLPFGEFVDISVILSLNEMQISRCLAKTLYEFNEQKRLTCHGRVMLRMRHEDFQDAREFIRHLSALIDRKSAEGSLQTKKIYCIFFMTGI